MKVLSLFDGMACARIALKELGIIPEVYYASEIDKQAIKQTQLNFPDTVQLGDVTKWRDWDIDWSSIDLILAGSPCQGFSFAGKQLAFDDPRSKLFFVFIDILNHCKLSSPNVKFLLENVNMKREYMRIISEYCGVFPVNINSNLVSAQNRDRWYWTNIRTKQVGLFGETYSDIPQPEDRKIFLRDILESQVDEKYYVSQSVLDRMSRNKYSHPSINPEKTGTLNTKNNSGQMSLDSGTTFICVAMRGREDGLQHFEPQNTGKTNCLTSVQKDNLILQRSLGYNKGGFFEDKTPTLSSCAWEQNNLLCERIGGISINDRGIRPHRGDYKKSGISELGTIIYDDQKTDTCTTSNVQKFIETNRIRRLTPAECSRLQTIPAWYKWECSDTQIYKMLGNGWTVEVIKHILSYLK